MRRIVLGALVLLFLAEQANAQWLYQHRDDWNCYRAARGDCSQLEGRFNSLGQFVVNYSWPRPGLTRIGVDQRTTLLIGSIRRGYFSGVAHRYADRGGLCWASYEVEGMFYLDGVSNLRAPRGFPEFDERRCARGGWNYDPRASQANLWFFFDGMGPGANLGDGPVYKAQIH